MRNVDGQRKNKTDEGPNKDDVARTVAKTKMGSLFRSKNRRQMGRKIGGFHRKS